MLIEVCISWHVGSYSFDMKDSEDGTWVLKHVGD